MRVGDRVLFTAMWSSFFGMKGRVEQLTPHIMVRIDGDSYPIRVGSREITVDVQSLIAMTGAE